MQSITRIKGSDGSANASMATVQSTRNIGATTLHVNTVLGWNAGGFYGSMGTPHTFTDPVTSETITVIDEATATDFYGHINSGNIEIDGFSPGYSDEGSAIGDIVVIRPTTDWSNNIAAALGQSLNDDGTMKGSAVRTALGETAPSGAGYTVLAQVPNTVTYNGNRNYSLVFNGVDLTSTLSNGMRLRTTRTLSAPVQCASLNGTNQYFNKTTPAGMSFTDDFTAGAWVKLTSYADTRIVSRYNGTSGWSLQISSAGQIILIGFNGGSGNFSYVQSYQSVPLNKWVHVAVQLDMSSFTATPTTSYIMINGIDVPATVARSGSNPTALIQAGNLEIGSENGGSKFFPGKIAQVFITSAKVTQANMRTIISQGITSTDVTALSMVSAYSLSNSLTDINGTSANNLSAQGSAVATNADAPFGGQASGLIDANLDYGIVASISFSTNTTVVVQVPEGCTIPTTGGVSVLAYSGLKVPYGFPDINRTLAEVLIKYQFSSSTIAGADVNGATVTLTPPTNKDIRIMVYGLVAKTGVAGDAVTLNIYEDGNIIQQWTFNMPGSNYATVPTVLTPFFRPVSGSHTYKLNMTAIGAGTMQFQGSSGLSAYLRIEAADL